MILIFCRIPVCLSFDPAVYLSLSFLLIPDSLLPSLTTFPTVAIFFLWFTFIFNFYTTHSSPSYLSLFSHSLSLTPFIPILFLFLLFIYLWLILLISHCFYIRNSFTTSVSHSFLCLLFEFQSSSHSYTFYSLSLPI